MTRSMLAGGLAAALAFGAAAPVAVQAAAPEVKRDCFLTTQWRGWSSPTADVLLLRVNRDVYKVDLAGSTPQLKWPGARLVSHVRGSSAVCSPLDLDLKVADSSGFSQPLFPTAITKLSAAEVAAIPRKDLPN